MTLLGRPIAILPWQGIDISIVVISFLDLPSYVVLVASGTFRSGS